MRGWRGLDGKGVQAGLRAGGAQWRRARADGTSAQSDKVAQAGPLRRDHSGWITRAGSQAGPPWLDQPAGSPGQGQPSRVTLVRPPPSWPTSPNRSVQTAQSRPLSPGRPVQTAQSGRAGKGRPIRGGHVMGQRQDGATGRHGDMAYPRRRAGIRPRRCPAPLRHIPLPSATRGRRHEITTP